MKTAPFLLIFFSFVMVIYSCKKESASTAETINAQTISQSLTGRWFVSKDSVQTTDYSTLIPNLVHPPVFNNNDFITFNPDSTVAISNASVFSAFYTDYQASNTDSKLQVITNILSILQSKYHVVLQGYSIPSSSSKELSQPLYALSIERLTALIGGDYSISMPDAKTLVLTRETEIPTLQHDFKIKESVYLHK